MDTFKFDAVARLFGQWRVNPPRGDCVAWWPAQPACHRRWACSDQRPRDASAKRRRRKNRKKKNQGSDRGKPEGSPCDTDGECRSSQKLICEIPFGAGNSDKACCRGQGATCSDSQHCCTGEAGGREFECVERDLPALRRGAVVRGRQRQCTGGVHLAPFMTCRR